MPVLVVHGIPNTFSQPQFRDIVAELREQLVLGVLAVAELGLKSKRDVTIYLVSDLYSHHGDEITIFVENLLAKPERTHEVLRKLANTLTKAIAKTYPRALIECCVRRPLDDGEDVLVVHQQRVDE
jgi:hypothetical protein